MSFSQDVKEEIVKRLPQRRKDRVSFLAAMFMQQGNRSDHREKEPAVYFSTEKTETASICSQLMIKTFGIVPECRVRTSHSESFRLKTTGKNALEICDALCMEGGLDLLDMSDSESKKNFIKGAFFCTGFMSDPKSAYHFEVVSPDREKADFLASQIEWFGIKPGVICRKKHFVLYIKDGSKIVDMLGIMDAHVCLMEMENSRILKEMRNSVNRRVNCETANIAKAVSAAGRQIEDIEYLKETGRLKELSYALRSVAQLRLENPEIPLLELGQLMDPPLGKSGVNHRLRKLSEIAKTERGESV